MTAKVNEASLAGLTAVQRTRLLRAIHEKGLAVEGASEDAPPQVVKPRRPQKNEEHAQQVILFSRVYRWEKTYPVVQLVHAVPNGHGGQKNDNTRLYMWSEGLRSGVPDVEVDAARVFRGTLYHGLRIEMKTETGEVSEKQAKQHALLISEGYLVFVKRDGLDAWALIVEYLGLPEECLV